MRNQYPLWKNIILVFGVILSIIYSVPNLYTEHPVLQISTDQTVDLRLLEEKLRTSLNQANLPFGQIRARGEGLEIVFSNTDTQLHAKDYLKTVLGPNDTLALNLASTTPAWLQFLGASPMKQGLDLRGGVHFLLEIDMKGVFNRRYETLVKSLGQFLREKKLHYTHILYLPTQGIKIQFSNIKDIDRARPQILKEFNSLALEPGSTDSEMIFNIDASERNQIQQDTLEQTMTILRNRVNELGVGEAVVQQQGAARIAVDLPGIQDAARAKQILGGTATLEFHLVDDDFDPSNGASIPFSSKWYEIHGQRILLNRQIVLSGDSITSSIASMDQETGQPMVLVQLGGGGESLFVRTTRENIGKRMAIVFVESKTFPSNDGPNGKPVIRRYEKVISAPVIQSALGTRFQITGLESKEAKNLSLLLRAGALPAAIYPVAERTVGPSLGKENIARGIASLEVGMGLILILMLVYYRFFGLVANIALMLNLLMLTALLSIIGATLTLPGIAGIVLTVGMAVDANVLIYERIREELRRGLSVQAAIYAGYERAFATIIDANITTLIVAVVLFSVGSGPVRGFAVTLSLGLLTSMISGISYTRGIVNAVYGSRSIKKLSIGI